MTEFENTLLIVVFPVAIIILYWQVVTLTRRVKRLEAMASDDDED
ncbi:MULTISPECIES: hypothetical protein [unclassified Mycobacterium]|nr:MULTISPECIES: hypothetical protein [unclassified Mycobacterium]